MRHFRQLIPLCGTNNRMVAWYARCFEITGADAFLSATTYPCKDFVPLDPWPLRESIY